MSQKSNLDAGQKEKTSRAMPSPAESLAVRVWDDGASTDSTDHIAAEVPVALVYNGISHVVMLASPADLEAFALGFSLSEGIIDKFEDVYGIEVLTLDSGMEVSLTLSSQCAARLKERRRNMSGRTGCGLCGAESLQQVRLPVDDVKADFTVSHGALNKATESLSKYQPLQASTGAVHGAAWCNLEGNILQVCEDPGRHNALDKLIGKLLQGGLLEQPGFLLISSRASFEMVQKSAMAGIGIVAAVSAPTTMAIDIAKQAGITLVGFTRRNRHVCYANPHRLVD